MGRITTVTIGVLALIVFALLFMVVPRTDQTMHYATSLLLGGNTIRVEVVNTPEGRQQGLSGRASLPDGMGMLFVFEETSIPSFWMKDMNFSIDIIWVDNNKDVLGIEPNISPDTFPQTFSPTKPVRYVLEVRAGWAEEYTIERGDKLELLE